MGGAGDSPGDSPAPVGDPPTGTAASNLAKRRSPLARTVAPVPSGESPVLPANDFSNTLLGKSQSDSVALVLCLLNGWCFAARVFRSRRGASDEHIPKWICKE